MSSIANVLRRIENAGIISPGTTATAWKDGTTPESGGGETTTKPPSGKPRHQLEEQQQQQQQRQRPPRKPAAGIDGVNRRRASAAARVVAEQHRRAEEVRHADDQLEAVVDGLALVGAFLKPIAHDNARQEDVLLTAGVRWTVFGRH